MRFFLQLTCDTLDLRSPTDADLLCSEETSDCRSETLSRYFAWSARIPRVSSCSSHPFIVHRTRGTMNQPLVTSVETQLHSLNSYLKHKKRQTLKWVSVFFGASNRTRLSACEPRSFAALKLHRSFIHYRSYFSSCFLSSIQKNIKHQSQGLMLYIWRLKQDSNLWHRG